MKKKKPEPSEKLYYAVSCMEASHGIDMGGSIVPLPLMWAPGMVGVVPVFDTYEAANNYKGQNKHLKVMMLRDDYVLSLSRKG